MENQTTLSDQENLKQVEHNCSGMISYMRKYKILAPLPTKFCPFCKKQLIKDVNPE